jgi:DNA polymerase IV
VILHVDMDAFFAAVEQLADPRLRGQPVLVCGSPVGRSVVAAASYEARPSGVRAGMPVARARRLCPAAILVPGDPAKYVSLSLSLLELFKRYSPQVEPFSIDEAFLDLGGAAGDGEAASRLGRALQAEVERKFSLTCSVGLGPNKLVAKMGSSLMKPRGFTRLTQEGFRQRFWPQPVAVLWGVGEETAKVLATLGVRTIGELANAPEGRLARTFGVNGPRLRWAARGEDSSPVVPYHQGVPNRSMGHEHTLAHDEADPDALEGLVLGLADRVARRLRQEGYVGRVVVLKLRHSDFTTRLRQRALADFTDEERTVARAARALLWENWAGQPLRLVGVTVAGLVKWAGAAPEPLFAEDRQYRRMVGAVDRVRDRFGEEALFLAGARR